MIHMRIWLSIRLRAPSRRKLGQLATEELRSRRLIDARSTAAGGFLTLCKPQACRHIGSVCERSCPLASIPRWSANEFGNSCGRARTYNISGLSDSAGSVAPRKRSNVSQVHSEDFATFPRAALFPIGKWMYEWIGGKDAEEFESVCFSRARTIFYFKNEIFMIGEKRKTKARCTRCNENKEEEESYRDDLIALFTFSFCKRLFFFRKKNILNSEEEREQRERCKWNMIDLLSRPINKAELDLFFNSKPKKFLSPELKIYSWRWEEVGNNGKYILD